MTKSESYTGSGVSFGPFYVETDGESYTAGVSLSLGGGEGGYAEAGYFAEVSYDSNEKDVSFNSGGYAEAGAEVSVPGVASVYAGTGVTYESDGDGITDEQFNNLSYGTDDFDITMTNGDDGDYGSDSGGNCIIV